MDIGSQLREARKQRGLTLEDISFETKIPPKILEAIERDDLSQLPRGPFARGFVRAYADAVNLDASDFLQPSVEPVLQPAEEEAPSAPDDEEVIEERRTAHGWLVVVLGIGVAYWIYGVPPRTGAGSSPSNLSTTRELAAEAERPADRLRDAASVPEGFQLRVSSTGACFVTATAAGRPIVSRLVPAGDVVSIPERGDVVLRVGDAGGCAYSLVGAPARGADQAQETVIRLNSDETGTLLARAASDEGAKSLTPEVRRVSVVQATGTTGMVERTREIKTVPLDASIGDLLPSAPLPGPSISPDQEPPQDISKG